jgi:hypothetical protein
MSNRRREGNRPALAVAALALAAVPGPASADVFLNEITVQGTERVELFNSGPGNVDVNGWKLVAGGGEYVIQNAPLLLDGGYVVVETGDDIFPDPGGFIELLDGVTPQDGTNYGQLGSAPLPPDAFPAGPAGPSLARAPDGSALGMPPTPDPSTDGIYWTIDLSSTFGAANDAPPSALGSTVLLNEIDPKPVGTGDGVELYNPVPFDVDVTGWLLCNGDAFQAISGTVPGGGHLVVTTDPGFELEENELLYLFRDDEVRVDQLGFHSPPVVFAPPLDFCQCYAYFPDGSTPSNGWDWFSSGGGDTFLRLLCTPGGPNQLVSDCAASPVAEMGADTWGRVKGRWRSR